MNVVGIIPARLQSSRLPEKLLLQETGKPLLQYVWEVATASSALHDVIIATDSERIFDTVQSFGGHAEMTADHPSGTDRVAEIARRCCAGAEVIVNLQGDEPELEPDTIEALVAAIHRGNTEMATVAAPIRDAGVVSDPDCVKVVVDDKGQALYFSRSTIPFSRDTSVADLLSADGMSPWLLHVGLYAYRRDFLLSLTSMPPSSLEQLEKLEQLRALQSGARIAVAVVPQAAVGIDTAEDYAAFVQRQLAADCR
ncbi:MAG: 3-deoxy-manno-octulosonate cytidylyltransferase [Fuerstiella sp.]